MKLGAVYRSCLLGTILCGANVLAGMAVLGADVPGEISLSKPGTKLAQEGAPELLALVRTANQNLYSNLQSFVCEEQIERFKGLLSGENPQHLDTVKTKVSFENGIEHYTEVVQDSRPRASIASIAGAWSEGEFGTLLQQTQLLLETQPVVFRTYEDLDGTPAALFLVEIPEGSSPWDLKVDRHHFRIPFRTEVWVSLATGQMLKIERVSTTVPSRMGISEMRWSVMLQAVQLEEKSWLLPKSGSYTVLYKAKGWREWNELKFSEYHRYGSEVALRFQ